MATLNVSVTQSNVLLTTAVSSGSTLDFVIDNPIPYTSYFTLETVADNNGFYTNSTSKNTSGSFTLGTGQFGLIQSDYMASVVVPSGSTTLSFVPAVNISASTLYLRGIGAGPYSTITSVDPDAQAFFDRVTTAGGSLTTTEQNAVNQLVVDMKSYGIWTAMKAIYPMVGASAAACAQNLKSSSFTGTFTSGWTFASSGINGNGTSTYMNTFLNPSSVLSSSANFFAYVNNNGTNLINTRDLDITDTATFENGLVIAFTNQTYSLQGTYSPLQYIQTPFNTSILGLFQANYISGTNYVIRNNSILTSAVQGQSYYNFPLYLGAANNTNDGSPFTPTDRRYALAGVSNGLTTAQASNLYTAVQAFQTTLSRQV